MMHSRQSPKRVVARAAPFKPADFIARHPLFDFGEFVAAHTAAGRSRATSAAVLRYHVRQGTLVSLRRGLYGRPEEVDPWALATRLYPDAVVAYDGALSFHELTGLGHSLTIATAGRLPPFVFRDVVYRAVKPPRGLEGGEGPGVMVLEREGQRIRVTTRERTFVDALDRLELGPGPKGLWDCFVEAGPLDARALVQFAVVLDSKLAAARLALFLQQVLAPRDPLLARLERLRPTSPAYFDRKHRDEAAQVYLRRWNLLVPRRLLLGMERDPRKRVLTSARAAPRR